MGHWHLVIAYAVTIAIHVIYLGYVAVKYRTSGK
jgi:hypothetical protein